MLGPSDQYMTSYTDRTFFTAPGDPLGPSREQGWRHAFLKGSILAWISRNRKTVPVRGRGNHRAFRRIADRKRVLKYEAPEIESAPRRGSPFCQECLYESRASGLCFVCLFPNQENSRTGKIPLSTAVTNSLTGPTGNPYGQSGCNHPNVSLSRSFS